MLDTGSEMIKLSQEERLLGANMTNDFLWTNHVRDHKKSLITLLKNEKQCFEHHMSLFFLLYQEDAS